MKKGYILAALCLLLAGCGKQEELPPVQKEEDPVKTPVVSLQSITVAPLEGQALSPDGNYEVRLEGYSTGITAMGYYPVECIQIVDIKTGDIKWEADGAYVIGAQWSDDGKFVAISRAARTWEDIVVVWTEDFSSCKVTLPDGSTFGDYHFVESMVWENTNEYDHRLLFTLDDENGAKEYGFQPTLWYQELGGDTFYRTAEDVDGSYDFTHDGVEEDISFVTVTDPNGTTVSWYEFRIEQEGLLLLSETFGTSRAGANTLLACRKDGKDYLLRYLPHMGMGNGNYSYDLFALGEAGETAQHAEVQFDVNFGNPNHRSFDPAAIAAFLKEAYGLMEQSTLLCSTENGEVRRNISGADFFWENNHFFELPRDRTLWEQRLRHYMTGESEQTRISPDGAYAATMGDAGITVMELASGHTMQVALPDERQIGSLTLDELRWLEGRETSSLFLLLTDGVSSWDYRFYPTTGETFPQVTTILDGTYDFDHDGITELIELDTIHTGEPAYYEVRLLEQGEYIWLDDAHPAHAGWNSVFACKWEGEDYLLRYHPTCYQGYCDYRYTLFSLNEKGEEVILRENSVSFDRNWGVPDHQFDPQAVAAFMEEINPLLDSSILLLSTDDELVGIDPAKPCHIWWEESFGEYTFDAEKTLAENLAAMNRAFTSAAAQTPVPRLPEKEFDFDHDGIAEQLAVKCSYFEESGTLDYVELSVETSTEKGIWKDVASTSHAGYSSLFACMLDGKDYLLRYDPYMNMGMGFYAYELFTLDGAVPVMVDSSCVEFDVNFGSATHQSFNIPVLADFLKRAYVYLESSMLLVSTEGGEIWEPMNGVDFFWENNTLFDLPQDTALWEQALKEYETAQTQLQKAL